MTLTVGHGQHGLRSGLRPFAEWMSHQSAERLVGIEIRPSLAVSGWSVYSGSTLTAPLSFEFDGRLLDVVAARTGAGELVRAQTLDECVDTAGSYYYDTDVVVDPTAWDDDLPWWDQEGEAWDQFPSLYVHPPSGEVVDQVVAEMGCWFGARGDVHPSLGDDLLAGAGAFELWADPATPTGWTPTGVTKVAGGSRGGSWTARLGVGGKLVKGSINLVAGRTYRLCGAYRTTETSGPCVGPYIKVAESAGANALGPNGRDVGGRCTLTPTGGEWRRFVCDFVARQAGTTLTLGADLGGGPPASWTVDWDDVEVRRVWRWEYWTPRISASSLPVAATASNDIFFGGKQIGTGSVTFENGDGYFERLFGRLDLLNREVRAHLGGTFEDDGQELPVDDYRRVFTGLIQEARAGDKQAVLQMQDLRSILHQQLPTATFTAEETPDIDRRFEGQPKPLWFGGKENVTPVGISKGVTGYRTYALADVSQAPNGIKAVDRVWAYASVEDARTLATAHRAQLVPTADYTVNLALAQMTIIKDVQVIVIDSTNFKLDYSDGTVRVALLTQRAYTPRTLSVEVGNAMSAASAGCTCTYSETTHKFTISKSSGTLSLLVSTGVNRTQSPWTEIGFTGSDRTELLSYTADDAIFVDEADTRHIVRVDGRGFADDALGTYTGTADALIEVGADILRTLWVRYLGRPMAMIDGTSFDFARSRAPEALGLYLKTPTSTKTLCDILEYSNVANVVIDGEGRAYYLIYAGEVPDGIPELVDADFLDWQCAQSTTDVYATIKVRFDQDPTTGDWESRTATDSLTGLRFGRSDMRTFDSLIRTADNAQTLASRFLALAQEPPVVYTFSVRGKLADRKVGDKVRVTRARALDQSGRLDGKVVRIISLKHHHQAGYSEAVAVPDVVTVASYECVSVCQSTCEHGCQAGCQSSCQSACEGGCQSTCQTACQTACELGCQSACEGGCQTGCQTSCQTACQASCQESCQVSCQGLCQVSCQNSCECVCQQMYEWVPGD